MAITYGDGVPEGFFLWVVCKGVGGWSTGGFGVWSFGAG